MEFIQLNGAQPCMTGYNSVIGGQNANFYNGWNYFGGSDTNNAIMQAQNTSGIAIQNIIGGLQRYVVNINASTYTILGVEDILTFSATCSVSLPATSSTPVGRQYTLLMIQH